MDQAKMILHSTDKNNNQLKQETSYTEYMWIQKVRQNISQCFKFSGFFPISEKSFYFLKSVIINQCHLPYNIWQSRQLQSWNLAFSEECFHWHSNLGKGADKALKACSNTHKEHKVLWFKFLINLINFAGQIQIKDKNWDVFQTSP